MGDQTISDRSTGALSPRSADENTPPPSVLGHGRMLQPVDPNAQNVQGVVTQLNHVLQARQQLIAALQIQPAHAMGAVYSSGNSVASSSVSGNSASDQLGLSQSPNRAS